VDPGLRHSVNQLFAVIQIDARSWNTMSAVNQALTLIHELGHLFNLVTGLGSSQFEYDVDITTGMPNAAAGERNASRDEQCRPK
jgi:hypothetical protein